MMSRYLTFLLILAISCCNIGCSDSSSDEPSQNACDNLRIIDGTECDLEGSPIVQVTLLLEDGNISICSGSVIERRFILTAAHCYDEDTIGQPVISSSVRIEGRDFEVRRVRIHPDANIPQNDAAIIELERSTSVRPLPILLSRNVNTGDFISIFGYGFDENMNFATLRSGQMEVTGITSQDIFARFDPDIQGSNVCFGDSGGPATLENVNGDSGIVGITSFATGAGCLDNNFSGFANAQSRSIFDFIFDVVPNVGVI